MISNNINVDYTYKLVLSDGSSWGFEVKKELRPWMESFAEILQLERCVSGIAEHKLHFSLLNDFKDLSLGKESKWNLYKSGQIFKLWSKQDSSKIYVELCPDSINDHSLSTICMFSAFKPIYRYCTDNGGGPLHAALGGLNNKGFLIAASGGTGKSTSLSRLPDYYEKLCDDTVLLINKGKDEYRAHPMPTWSDLMENISGAWKVNNSLPLKAIFFLEQADTDEVIELAPGQASLEIFDSFKQSWISYWNRIQADRKKEISFRVFENSLQLSKALKCYRLKATLDGEFWKEIEKVL